MKPGISGDVCDVVDADAPSATPRLLTATSRSTVATGACRRESRFVLLTKQSERSCHLRNTGPLPACFCIVPYVLPTGTSPARSLNSDQCDLTPNQASMLSRVPAKNHRSWSIRIGFRDRRSCGIRGTAGFHTSAWRPDKLDTPAYFYLQTLTYENRKQTLCAKARSSVCRTSARRCIGMSKASFLMAALSSVRFSRIARSRCNRQMSDLLGFPVLAPPLQT